MTHINAVLALILCITVSFTCIATAQASVGKVFSLPEENGNIILSGNASYFEEGTQYYLDNYTGLQIYTWYLPMFTTGNGTANIYASAQDCNLTVNSYKQATTPMEAQYMYNVSSSIDCTVAGGGVAHITVTTFDSSNLAVYINGVLRQAGDGWNLTGGYIALQGPADVSVYSSEADYWPPRDAPHNDFAYTVALLIAAAVSVLAIAGAAGYAYSKHKHRDIQHELAANADRAWLFLNSKP